MMRSKRIFPQCAAVFIILLCAYLLVFSGFSSTDDEQLFSIISVNLAYGNGYSALPLYGNDRIRGETGGVEPLHSILGIPLVFTAGKLGLGKVQILYLLPAVYTALTGALLAAISKIKGFPQKTSLLLGLVYGLGTIAFPYARTNFREPLAALLITISIFCVEKSVEKDLRIWKNIFLPTIGFIFLILAALTKITTAVLIPFLVIYFITRKHSYRRENRSKFLLFILSAVILLIFITTILQLTLPANSLSRFTFRFFDYILYTLPRLPHDHFWTALAGLFISPGKGLLIYSPVLLLVLISPFLKQKMRSDWFIYIGAFLALAGVQALIYNDQWWSITWGTRALIPALPLVCLAALPVLDAGLNNKKKLTRYFTVFLLANSGCVQIGRLITSDPVYANWVVLNTGQSINAMTQWDLRLAPLVRHWWLAGSNQTSDIAWLYINTKGLVPFLFLVLFSSIGSWICISRILNKDSQNPVSLPIIICLLLAVLTLTPISAQFDQRYNRDVIVFREISVQVCEQVQSGDLVLIDSYLNPFWWYYTNFGCSKADWVSLPYLHQTAINNEQYFPRISDISKMVQDALSNEKQVFLIQSPQEHILSYSEELERADFLMELIQDYTNPNMRVFKIR